MLQNRVKGLWGVRSGSIKRCECVPDLENSFLTAEIGLRMEKVSQEQPVSCIAALAVFAAVKVMEKVQGRKFPYFSPGFAGCCI